MNRRFFIKSVAAGMAVAATFRLSHALDLAKFEGMVPVVLRAKDGNGDELLLPVRGDPQNELVHTFDYLDSYEEQVIDLRGSTVVVGGNEYRLDDLVQPHEEWTNQVISVSGTGSTLTIQMPDVMPEWWGK